MAIQRKKNKLWISPHLECVYSLERLQNVAKVSGNGNDLVEAEKEIDRHNCSENRRNPQEAKGERE